jgi:hypothetical protein
MSRGRQRAIAIVASAQSCCGVCEGVGEVKVRAIPEGAWVTTPCPHCQPRNGAPIFPLPWRHEQEGGAA